MNPYEVTAAVDRQRAIEKRPTLVVAAGEFTYPPDHQLGMAVPEGGSSCSNCRFLLPVTAAGPSCSEPNFVSADLPGKPRGEAKIPGGDARRYCSDLWQLATAMSLDALRATGSV